jgi:hypothetical protein
LAYQAVATARAPEPDAVARLARFFPQATPVRIPIRLSRIKGNGSCSGKPEGDSFLQETVIEFGTPREVLFATAQPLEFGDRVLVESKDGALRAEGHVVAVHYHPGRTVVAARFVKEVSNWIVKP